MRAKNRNPGAGSVGASGSAVPVKNTPEINQITESAQPCAVDSARKKRRARAARGALSARTVRVPAPWRFPLQVYDGQEHIGALDDRTEGDPPERVVIAFAVDVAGHWRALGGFPSRIEASRAIPLRPRSASGGRAA